MSDSNRSYGGIPVPYPLGGEVAPRPGYYYPDYSSGAPDEETADLGRIARLLWRRKWWLLAAAALGLAAGWIGGQFLPKEYETFTKLSVEDQGSTRGRQQSGPISGDPALAGAGWPDVFRSRAVITPVVRELGLQASLLEPAGADRGLVAGLETTASLVPGVYSLTVQADGRWSLARDGEGTIQTGAPGEPIGEPAGFHWTPDPSRLEPGTEYRFRVSTEQGAVQAIAGRLGVGYRSNANIIDASLQWPDPQEGARVLNALAESFIGFAEDMKTQKIQDEVAMLREQTEITRQRLESSEMALQSQRVSSITEPTEPLVAPVQTGDNGSAGVQIDPLFGAFASNKLEVDQLQLDLQRIRQVQASLAGGGEPNLLAIQMIPSVANSSELQAAIADLESKMSQRRTLLYTYTENHPQVEDVDQQIQDLRYGTIPAALDRLAGQIQSQVDMLNSQIQNQGEQLREIPARTIRTARLQRDVQHAAELHNNLDARLKAAELAQATSGPGIKLLDPAWPNPTPQGDAAGRLMMLCSLGAFGIGIAGVLAWDKLDKRIHSPGQLTGSLGLPVLGVVPRLDAAPDPTSPSAAIAIESFRGLRTQIAHVDGKLEGVTLVTSAAPREGKSMVSANLAISYASAGYRTLLLDGDTRRGRAQEMFNLSRSPGLTDYLMERATLAQVEQATGVPNLTLIARGAPGGFNHDLLESDRMSELMETLREAYDVTVIDGPPLAAGADVMILGNRADKVVFVVRAGATKEDLARAKLDALGHVQLPIVGAVLNAMPRSSPEYEYYVHYYYADVEAAS